MNFSRRQLFQGVSVLGLTSAAFFALNTGDNEVITEANAQDLSDLMTAGLMGDNILGEDDAAVTIIEYASLTCPHCANFHKKILPSIKEKYIDTGKAKLIFRGFPLNPRDYAAFMLAGCADKKFYFPMTNVFFEQQQNWATAEDPRPPLLQIAKMAGFTQESFEECLKNQELLDNVNQVKTKAAEQYGVTGTPSFFINGEKYNGKISVEDMSASIDSHL